MKWITQEELLELLEKRVEQHIQKAIRTFQNLPEEQLNQPAPNGGWSIAQCLDHLNSYGHYYLPAIKNRLDGYSANPALQLPYKSSLIGRHFIRMVEPETGKRKQKAFKAHLPSPNPDAHVAVAEFIRQQEALLQYLALAKRVNISSIRIPVSFAHWLKLKLGDLLQFIIAHNQRHMLQANALLQE